MSDKHTPEARKGPGDAAATPPGRGEYQVWHANDLEAVHQSRMERAPYGHGYTHVASVEARDLQHAVELTVHGDRAWWENPEVKTSVAGSRSTAADDVIVDPQGRAYRFEGHQTFREVEHDSGLRRREDHPLDRAPSLQRGAEIRVQPGKDNPLYRREDRSFDIHDATGKIGHLAGYMGGPWSETEFRITHVEISRPGRSLTPGEWKGVLHGLGEQLPDAEYIGGNRTGEGGDLFLETLKRLPHPEAANEHRPAAPSPERQTQEEATPRPRLNQATDLFPADEPTGFQVWHKQGKEYRYVADVNSNALGAMLMTTHGFMDYPRWQDNPAVTATPGEHRSTTLGDVLIGRDGQALEIAADDGLRLKPIAPIGQRQEAKALTPSTPDPARRAQYQQKDSAKALDR
jgi:hypothetical protein